MVPISIEQAIRNAIHVEEAAAQFYADLSGQAADDDTRTFFDALRFEELRHAAAIEELGVGLADGTIPPEATPSWDIIETSPVWRHVEGITYAQALEVALESERGAAMYYEALAATATSEPVRSFFESLAATEHVHVRKIIELMDRQA